MKNDKIKRYFDTLASTWDANIEVDQLKLRQIIKFLDVQVGHNVLDVACGTGVLFAELLALGPKQLVGIDISETMIECAGKKYCDPALNMIAEDFFKASCSDFDRIIIYNAYPHFLNKRKLQCKIYDALKDGGRFVIAHSNSRAQINKIHNGHKTSNISVMLQPAKTECKWFAPYFNIDICIDTDDLYVISGTK